MNNVLVIQTFFCYDCNIEYNQEYCSKYSYDYILLPISEDIQCLMKHYMKKYDYLVYMRSQLKLFDDLFKLTNPTIYFMCDTEQIIVLPNKTDGMTFICDWIENKPNIFYVREQLEE